MTENEEELLNSVENLSRCLVEHVSTDAARLGVKKEELCPCWDVEVKEALGLMEKYRGDDDGEEQGGYARTH